MSLCRYGIYWWHCGCVVGLCLQPDTLCTLLPCPYQYIPLPLSLYIHSVSYLYIHSVSYRYCTACYGDGLVRIECRALGCDWVSIRLMRRGWHDVRSNSSPPVEALYISRYLMYALRCSGVLGAFPVFTFTSCCIVYDVGYDVCVCHDVVACMMMILTLTHIPWGVYTRLAFLIH